MNQLDAVALEELRDLETLPTPVRLRRLEHGHATMRREMNDLNQMLAVLVGQVRLAAAFGAIVGAAIATAVVGLLVSHYIH